MAIVGGRVVNVEGVTRSFACFWETRSASVRLRRMLVVVALEGTVSAQEAEILKTEILALRKEERVLTKSMSLASPSEDVLVEKQ